MIMLGVDFGVGTKSEEGGDRDVGDGRLIGGWFFWFWWAKRKGKGGVDPGFDWVISKGTGCKFFLGFGLVMG